MRSSIGGRIKFKYLCSETINPGLKFGLGVVIRKWKFNGECFTLKTSLPSDHQHELNSVSIEVPSRNLNNMLNCGCFSVLWKLASFPTSGGHIWKDAHAPQISTCVYMFNYYPIIFICFFLVSYQIILQSVDEKARWKFTRLIK